MYRHNDLTKSKISLALKRRIRKRDGEQCVNCSEEDVLKLTVHHVNYDKRDCREDNLITLCRSCNPRANFGREIWKTHFQAIMRDRVGVQV